MRGLLVALASFVLASLPAAGQSSAALEQMTEGFGRGQCDALAHLALSPETREWTSIDPSPWAGWIVKRIGPRTLEYVRPGDEARLMEFDEGVYRDRAPGSMEGAEEWIILEHGVHGSDNWRILMTPPEFSETTPIYSELIIAGDVFIWTNWADQSDGSRIRTMYFACRFVDG
jgi:hypothetical protein